MLSRAAFVSPEIYALETERIFGQVEDAIREVVPESDRAMVLDNIGLTQSFTIMAYVANGTVSNAVTFI